VIDLLGASVGVFAGTNVDDLVVLTVLFLAARAGGRPRPVQIWAGQYTGIGVLVAVSALAALGLAVVPGRWVGLLGLVPLALGVRGLVGAVRSRGATGDDGPAEIAAGTLPVAGVTIANGADNIEASGLAARSAGADAFDQHRAVAGPHHQAGPGELRAALGVRVQLAADGLGRPAWVGGVAPAGW